MVGYDCWICGLDEGEKGIPLMDFHHVKPEDKIFAVSTREMVGFSWERVLKEIQKCVSICCLCHRKYHCGLLTDEDVQKAYTRWKDIKLDP